MHKPKKRNSPAKFRVGAMVTWTSQSAGTSKTKTGKVVAIIQAGDMPKFERFYGTHSILYGGGGSRDHISYLVETPGPSPAAMRRLYWPQASRLVPTR